MVASQMAAARYDNTVLEIDAVTKNPVKTFTLRSTVSQIKFPGFISLYVEGRDESEPKASSSPLPDLRKGEPLILVALFPKQNFTEPPPRYTEATLVKAMEQKGIGRPSTYAPILSTIQKREYVRKEQGRFLAKKLGLVVTDLLADNFKRIVDLDFTARLEGKLDEIASGKTKWVPSIKSFWTWFEADLNKAHVDVERVQMTEESDEVCQNCGKPMLIKVGRFGRFLACSGYPDCKTTRPFKIGVNCPDCGKPLVMLRSKAKKSVFYGCSGYPDCKFISSNRPLSQPCPKCGSMTVSTGKSYSKCTKCDYRGKTSEPETEVEK
jgi:DNA topoisomerase-1